jgi:hypothetical protein
MNMSKLKATWSIWNQQKGTWITWNQQGASAIPIAKKRKRRPGSKVLAINEQPHKQKEFIPWRPEIPKNQ